MSIQTLITEVQKLYDGSDSAIRFPIYKVLSYLWDVELMENHPHLRPTDCLVFLDTFWSGRNKDTPVHAATPGSSNPIHWLTLCGERTTKEVNAVYVDDHVPNCPNCIEKLKTGTH